MSYSSLQFQNYIILCAIVIQTYISLKSYIRDKSSYWNILSESFILQNKIINIQKIFYNFYLIKWRCLCIITSKTSEDIQGSRAEKIFSKSYRQIFFYFFNIEVFLPSETFIVLFINQKYLEWKRAVVYWGGKGRKKGQKVKRIKEKVAQRNRHREEGKKKK